MLRKNRIRKYLFKNATHVALYNFHDYRERIKNVTQFIYLDENNDVIDLYDNVSYSARNTVKRFFLKRIQYIGRHGMEYLMSNNHHYQDLFCKHFTLL